MLFKLLIELVFPRFCVGCDRLFTFLCPNCYEQIDFLTLPIKPKVKPNYLDQLIACCNYKPPISNLIKELKYNHVKDIALTCAQLVYYAANIPQTDLITAVPLHPKRLKERGFNQAELIAKHLSTLTSTPYQNLLVRTKHTKNQASITDKEHRLANLHNIFSIQETFKDNSDNKSVLVIDDVTTTGATLNECAKVLKQHHFGPVIGLTIAHGQ